MSLDTQEMRRFADERCAGAHWVLLAAAAEIDRLREALGFYATDELYRGHDPGVLLDCGAREALGLGKEGS